VRFLRNANLSYTSLEHGCGFSGTETALLEMTNYLVQKGHSVQIYGVNETYIDHGVKFFSEKDIDQVDLDVDWYSPIFFLGTDFEKALQTRINPNRTKYLLWFHCFITDEWVLTVKQFYEVYGQYVSNYVANEYTSILDKDRSWTIYNGLNKIFTECAIPKSIEKKGNWIFHSTYERGGEIARQIFEKINYQNNTIANKLDLLSYYSPDNEILQSSDKIVYNGSKNKKEVREFLLKSDYFVYPLVLPTGQVNHDTFGMVILEALACGCIVIVWDVACISSVYEDYVIKIPVPEHAKITGYQRVSNEAEPIQFYNPLARYGNCPWMQSDEAQQLFIDAILKLETNQDKKEMIRMKGVEWARKYTWESLGSAMESQLLSHS